LTKSTKGPIHTRKEVAKIAAVSEDTIRIFKEGSMVNKFRLARMQEGKKQIEVATESGVPVSVLSLIENGWRFPTPSQVEKLEKTLPKLKELMERNE
jgi:DNA-binding XRE family transcriptional regulator